MMRNLHQFLAIVFFLAIATSVFSQQSGTTISSPKEDSIFLSSTELKNPCPPGRRGAENCVDQSSTEVEVFINSVKRPDLTYEYSITGGKIIGSGQKVRWDLIGIRPGTYTITATVKGRKNFHKTFSRTVTYTECHDCGCGLCECPGLSISTSAETATEGEEITFIANVSGGSQISVKYQWVLTNGEILAGQNSPSITVSTKGLAGKSVTATVKLTELCEVCDGMNLSKTISVSPKQMR